jgi:hypothetical protein
MLACYADLVPRGLDAFEPEDRRWTYGRIRLKIFGHSDGTIVAAWAFGQDTSVISGYTREGEALRILAPRGPRKCYRDPPLDGYSGTQ